MGKFNFDSKIKDILKDARARNIVEEYLPGILNNSQLPLIMNMKAKNIVGKGRYINITQEQEQEIINKILSLD